MEAIPRLKKRGSLTLGRRQKGDASPHILQTKTRSAAIANNTNENESNLLRTPKSISSNGGIECTPPHKKINLDDSIEEYSPKCFDASFSPSYLLSQTLSSGSPEVGWKWGRRSVDERRETSVATPDSAYAADSSFTSAGSSSTEVINAIERIRSESHNHRFAYEIRKEEQRRKRELQIRRAEKLRADELLKQRCAKLEEELREAEKRRRRDIENKTQSQTQPQKPETISNYEVAPVHSETVVDLQAIGDAFANANDTLSDFFNDSDSDGILLQATQQVESKIVELTQKSPAEVTASGMDTNGSSINTSDSELGSLNVSNEVPASERQEKRSSLYMKFLEDDLPDDCFFSLDEVILQATQQGNKSRNNFQRYNSMPTRTLTTLATGSAALGKTATSTTTSTTTRDSKPTTLTTAAVSTPKIKRHASSHVLNPTSSDAYTLQQLHEYHLTQCKAIICKILRREVVKSRLCKCNTFGFRR
ncbi:uncharacterized protein LOC128855083 isoform X1 [Anastrepha ludens]|uniref:uncharacterized protein LOC128855083 isoform X1 n=2 Tax=Anastrepha ludens TaxID=28586 RepID=UPI0023B01213|nr:uncharacterized protein LOC128855083 isoform X1 [Anastrepha ludens]